MDIKSELMELVDEKYRTFTSALLPDVKDILGVRIPELRKIARNIAKSDWKGFFEECREEYFEETMVKGMVLGYIKESPENRIEYIKRFIPSINNWSVCDSFCATLKFTEQNRELVWNFILPMLDSEKEFEVRFAVVMILDYFIVDKYIKDVLKRLGKIKNPAYYSRMAVAWAVSICYIKYPEITMEFLKDNDLDDFTYNKALQKIRESFRVTKEEKNLLNSMKRK